MEKNYTKAQTTLLVILRLFIGWHFLYEGLVKLINPSWSALSYLQDAGGLFAPIFTAMASNAGIVSCVDILNEWGLLLVGLALILGCFTRLASIGGMLLLLLYYLSHPAFVGVEYAMSMEGSYFLIDKNLVELAALGVLFVFPISRYCGLDSILIKILPKSFQKFVI